MSYIKATITINDTDNFESLSNFDITFNLVDYTLNDMIKFIFAKENHKFFNMKSFCDEFQIEHFDDILDTLDLPLLERLNTLLSPYEHCKDMVKNIRTLIHDLCIGL